jgi:hypothetical protein
MTMFMGAISTFMSEVTKQLERDAENQVAKNDVSAGIKEMLEVDKDDFWVSRLLLLKNTMVDFEAAATELKNPLRVKHEPRGESKSALCVSCSCCVSHMRHHKHQPLHFERGNDSTTMAVTIS